MVTLENSLGKTISAHQMNCGQLAVIAFPYEHEGKIVQRFQGKLIVIGRESDDSFPYGCETGSGIMVRLLRVDDTILVLDN